MNVEQLARLGQEMRKAQKRYFATRGREALRESIALENRFDEACRAALDGPPEPDPIAIARPVDAYEEAAA